MKKLFLLTIALVMTLSLAACGGKTDTTAQSSTTVPPSTTAAAATMVDVTFTQGISLKLPSDLTQADRNGVPVYINTATADMVMAMDSPKDKPVSTWTKDDVLDMLKTKLNVEIKSFENDKKISGKDALITTFTYTMSKDDATKINAAFVIIEDGDTQYTVLFNYGQKDSSLAANLQACFDSISYEHAEEN